MATITKRGKSYLISTSCGYDGTGKQLRKTMTWKPEPSMTARQEKKAVNAAAVRFEDQVQSGQYIDPSITLNSFIDQWLSDYAKISLRADTVRNYELLLPHIRDALGHIHLAKLQPHHIIEFLKNLSEDGMRRDGRYTVLQPAINALEKSSVSHAEIARKCGVTDSIISRCLTGKRVSLKTATSVCKVLGVKLDTAFEYHGKRGLSGNTLLHYYHLLQSIMSTAVKWQVIPSNPCSRVEPPRKGTSQQAVLSVEEAQRLITCLDSESIMHRAAVLLLLYSGARRSELYGLEWSDIDMEKMQINIHRTWQRMKGGCAYQPCKNASSVRIVALPDCCRQILDELHLHLMKCQLICGDAWEGSKALMTTDNGSHASPDELTSWFRKFCRRNNFSESVHIHTLRHTSATLQIASHLDIRSVSARLGHSQTSTTLNIYAHAVQSADAKAADVLGDLLNTKKAVVNNK